MTPHKPDEVVGRVPGECRFMEVRISRNEVFGRGVGVGEIASSASGDPNFLADRFVAFENQNGSSALSRFDRAHQPGSTGANNHDIVDHLRILYCSDAFNERRTALWLCTKWITRSSVKTCSLWKSSWTQVRRPSRKPAGCFTWTMVSAWKPYSAMVPNSAQVLSTRFSAPESAFWSVNRYS